VWIFSDGGSGESVTEFAGTSMRGALGFSPMRGIGQKFEALTERWASTINVEGSGGILDGVFSSPDTYTQWGSEMNPHVPYAYDAMTMLLRGIEALAQRGVTPCTLNTTREYRSLLAEELRGASASFVGASGSLSFDANQDRMGGYVLRNLGDGDKWNDLGTWAPEKGLLLAVGAKPVWNNITPGVPFYHKYGNLCGPGTYPAATLDSETQCIPW
jgi:hypothetical protein